MTTPIIVVVGAGVVGLSTAIEIQERIPSAKVYIVAEVLPGDPKSIKYTSLWAGAHHVSLAENEGQLRLDSKTFRRMWEMSEGGHPAEHCFLRLQQTEYYSDKRNNEGNTDRLHFMPDYRVFKDSELIEGSLSGVEFTTLTIDTPVYLPYLLSRFESAGGTIIRASISALSSLLTGTLVPEKPSAIISCPGLGAATIKGIEDPDVYPIRGQTVLVRTPWVRFGRTLSEPGVDGIWTYIIPRRSGDVILGGVKQVNDFRPEPLKEITEDILRRCLKLCPELVTGSPEFKSSTSGPEAEGGGTPRKVTVDDLRPFIIEEGCGLRPARKGGIRFEVDWLSAAESTNGKIPVIHHYGHGGFGYQSSWGSAEKAVDLLQTVL
ncbi:uncharacterized protein EI90DRAFT_3279207 [Cantharellus anzutake]|uniref:uncharacterized protein n=1 Tax=Cantharellus anzutake TaxID=1750568 RepID=UPI0019042062|nr:uncharacterized protein EI90DRAFT_3279207 [Cantharellus anzutake]KAF8339534.1 hypothetical protein EI90DRAFT_3279207 [Cantharellus anzutake]